MHQVLNFFVVLISLKKLATPVNGSGDVNVEDYIDPFDYAALVNIKDELLIGDTALAIDHIDEDIDKFEELSKKIHYLESSMAQHTSNHIVDGDDVEAADLTLKEMDIHVLGVFKKHLVDLKEQMMQPHPPFNNETMQQIGALVNTAELFLNMSKMRVNQVEAQEEEWLEEEQSKMINDLMKKQRSENQMKVFRKKQPSKTWDGGLKEKLEKVEKAGGEDAPVGRGPAGRVRMVVDKVKGVKEGQEAELQRRKKLTVESEGKFFWKALDELASQENSRQETDRKLRKVQLRGVEEGAYLVEQHREEGDDGKSSRESFLKQGIGRHRLVFASASAFHSYHRFIAISSLVLVALAVAVVFCRKSSRSLPQRRQLFAELGPEVMVKKQQEQGLSPAEAKEKGGFSYVELNEKRSPRGPGGEAATSWASGLAAVALTPFRRSPRVPGSRGVDKME